MRLHFQCQYHKMVLHYTCYLADGGVGDDDPEVAAAAHDVLRRVHRVDEVDEHLRALVAAAISSEKRVPPSRRTYFIFDAYFEQPG